MTLLNLRHKGKSIGVPFPTTVGTVNRVVLELKRGYDPPGPVRIMDTKGDRNYERALTFAAPHHRRGAGQSQSRNATAGWRTAD